MVSVLGETVFTGSVRRRDDFFYRVGPYLFQVPRLSGFGGGGVRPLPPCTTPREQTRGVIPWVILYDLTPVPIPRTLYGTRTPEAKGRRVNVVSPSGLPRRRTSGKYYLRR